MTKTWVLAGTIVALVAGVSAADGRVQQALGVAPPRALQLAPPAPMTVPSRADAAARYLPATTALFQSYVRSGKMPGIVGAFGHGDDPTLFVSAGRIADGAGAAAAGPDSLWRVYSMTKPITAAAAMILVQEGKIALDDPLAKYFPGFAHMQVLDTPDGDSLAAHPATHPITIRNLLTHTAGLGYNIITRGALLKAYERAGILPATVNRQVEAQMRIARPATLAAFAQKVATLPLIAEPGTKWSYSIGLDVMGAVIEKASGMPFDRFVQTRIFAPLGMRSSFWTVPAADASRLATNYLITPNGRTPIDPGATSVWLQPPSFPYGGAGLVMSARDYDAFLHMLQDGGTLNGVTILTPQTTALMMSNLLPAGVTFGGTVSGNGGAARRAATPMGFGAGGSVYLADGPGGHPGKGTYGWGGAAGTIAFVDPKNQARGTVMVNYFPGEAYPLREQTAAALVRDDARLRAQ